MKRMKKIVAAVLAALMMVTLAGCGEFTKAGTYTITKMEMNGTMIELTDAMTGGETITFNLKWDGTFTGESAGDSLSGEWELDGDKITIINENGDDAVGTFDGDSFTIALNGVKVVFEKE